MNLLLIIIVIVILFGGFGGGYYGYRGGYYGGVDIWVETSDDLQLCCGNVFDPLWKCCVPRGASHRNAAPSSVLI